MNFYAHAVVAELRGAGPARVLGAMLPDLAAMAGRRIARVDDPALCDGVRLHHRTDAVFHASGRFHALLGELGAALRARGLAPGAARGAAHVGVELLLDGALAARYPPSRLYRGALDRGGEAETAVAWRAGRRGGATTLAAVCRRIAAADLPRAYADPGFTARRVERVLASRPRLALRPGEPTHVADALGQLAPRVAASAAALLAEVGDALDP